MGCLGAAFAAMQNPSTATLKNWRSITVTPLVYNEKFITLEFIIAKRVCLKKSAADGQCAGGP
jgi:hypothetical protein